MDKEIKKTSCKCNPKGVDTYSGVEIDVADDCKVSSKAVKDYTAELNNNHAHDLSEE